MVINWSQLTVFEKKDEVVTAPWLMALELISDATHLKIQSEGKWYAENSVLPSFGPDGLSGITLSSDQLTIAGCRFGALIGKIGGSSADHHSPETPVSAPVADEPFAVGAFCTLKIPDNIFGPLFLGFNASSYPIHVETLKVTVFGARPTV